MQHANLTQREMRWNYQLKEDAERWMTLVALLAGVAASVTIIFVHAAA